MHYRTSILFALIILMLILVPITSAETADYSFIGGPPVASAQTGEYSFIGGPPGNLGATPAPVLAADTASSQAEPSPSPSIKPSPVPTKSPLPATTKSPAPTRAPITAEAAAAPVPTEAPAMQANAKVLDADGTLLLNDDPERYFVQVDETNQVVTVFERDAHGRHTIVARQMICSTGKRSTPSPNGTYKMGDERIRFGFFVKHNCYGQYWSQITRNIYFHSVLYSERNTGSLIKSSFDDLGKAVSHGCVRLMPQDAKWIYQNIPEGTKVDFTHKIKKDAALTKSLKPDKYVD